MYAFLDDEQRYVRRSADSAVIPWDAEAGGPLGGGAAWRQWEEDGAPSPSPYAAPPPSIEGYRSAIQALVDTTAQSRNYDSGITCASYVGSTNPTWAAEAAAFIAWRDAVWSYAYGELAKVQAGEREQPEIAAFIDELPAIDWPA